MADGGTNKAVLYREETPEHTCPFGLKAKQLLEEADFKIEEHVLRTRKEVDEYKAQEGVATTPQVFIDGKRIGGSDDLEQWLAHERAR